MRAVLTSSRSSGWSSSLVPGSFPSSSMYLRISRFSKTVPIDDEHQRLSMGVAICEGNATNLFSSTPRAPLGSLPKLPAKSV
jgi:hypothetical protein